MSQTPTAEGGAMWTVMPALVGLVVAGGWAAEPPAGQPFFAQAVRPVWDGGFTPDLSVPVRVADPKPRGEAAVSLDWTGPATVRRGRPAEYVLTVANTGRVAAQKVTVQAKPPTDAVVAAPAARTENGVLVWDVGTLEPGDTCPLRVTLTPGQRGELACPAWVTFTSAVGMAVRVQEPKLEVALVTPATTPVGDRLDVAVVVTNTGDMPLDGADVSLTIPNPVPVDLGSAGTATAYDSMLATCGPLAPGQSWTKHFLLRPGVSGDVLHTAEAQCRNEPGVRASATKTVRVVAPKLSATLAGPDKLLVGRTGNYTLTVRNAGELAVDTVNVVVPLPAGLRATSPNARLDSQLGTLKPGEERLVKFDAVATAVGVQPVAVAVSGSRGATAAAECRTAVDGVPALRVELLDTADPVEVGRETTYEVRVTNTGTKADEDVTVVCEVPEGMAFVSGSGPTAHTLPPAGGRVTRTVVFDPVRELAPKTEAVFRVKVKAGAVCDVRFKATVTSKHLTAPVVKEESTRVYGD